MKINHSKQRIIYEFTVMGLCFCFLIIAVLFDTFNLPVLELLRIKINPESMHMSLFTVQATVSVTGAAIISLLTGVTSKNYYGVSVSKFFTRIYPFVLKHNTVILFTFIITVVDYFAVALKGFDLSLSVFICSIILLMYLVKDTFIVFLGEDEMKKRISETIVMSDLDSFASSLFSQSISFAQIGLLYELKDNMSLVKLILSNEEVKYKTTSNEAEIKRIEDFLLDLLKIIVKRKQPDEVSYILNYFQSLYKDANQNTVSFDLWWKNPHLFFESYRYLTFDEYKESPVIFSLFHSFVQNEKYDKDAIQDSTRIFNNYLIYYSGCVYKYLFKPDNQSLLYNNKERIIISLYENIFLMTYIKNTVESDYDWLLLQLDLCNLLKELIDDGYSGKVWNKLFSGYESAKNGQSSRLVRFCVANYLYYLAVNEPLAKGKPAQMRSTELLREYSGHILSEFGHIDLLEFLVENKQHILSVSSNWEWIPDKRAKAVINQFATQNFIVFLSLNTCWDDEVVRKIIELMFDKSMYCVYDRYFRDESTFEKIYSGFNSLFYGEQRSIDDVKARLYSIISKGYRNEMISEGIRKTITPHQVEDYKRWLLDVCNEAVQEYRELFSEEEGNDETQSDYKTIRLYAINSIAPLSDDHSNQYIRDAIHRNMLSAYLQIIKDNLLTDHIRKADRKVQQTIIESISSASINPAIMIGGNDIFWMEKDKNQLRDYLERHGITTIRDLYCRDEYFFIDPSQTRVDFCRFNVVIRDLTFSEIMNSCEMDEEGKILYNVTNDIYLPFEKEEIVDHMHRTRKMIEIYADLLNNTGEITAGLHFVVE